MIYNAKLPRVAYIISASLDTIPRKLSPEEISTIFEQRDDKGVLPLFATVRSMLRCEKLAVCVMPGLGNIWFDDEAKSKQLPENEIATMITQMTTDGMLLRGDALLVPTDYSDPDNVEACVTALWEEFRYARQNSSMQSSLSPAGKSQNLN